MGPICVACRVQLKCVKTGRVVRWDRRWCYSGDEYACSTCGARLIVNFGSGGFENRADLGDFLEMPEGTKQVQEERTMPLELTRNELAKVMSGEAIGVTRFYGGECPHEVGGRVLLAFRSDPGATPEVVVEATLVSVRPFTVKERREDHEEAQKEGWTNAFEWWGHFERMYTRTWLDSDVLHRLQLRVDQRVENVKDSGDALPFLK